jgi:hypothetical protein
MTTKIIKYNSRSATKQLGLPRRVFYVGPDKIAIISYEGVPPISLYLLVEDIFPLYNRLPIHCSGKYVTLYRGIAMDSITAEKIKGIGFLSEFFRKNMAEVYENAGVHPVGLRIMAKYASELRAEPGGSVVAHVKGSPRSIYVSTSKKLSIAKYYAKEFMKPGKNPYVYEIRLPIRHVLNPYHPDFWNGKLHPKLWDVEVLVQCYIPPEYIVDYWQIFP